jgi:nitrate/nitrite-specific signal transduction histidine kinase
MRRRLEDLGGSCEIHNESSVGTKVAFSIQLKSLAAQAVRPAFFSGIF